MPYLCQNFKLFPSSSVAQAHISALVAECNTSAFESVKSCFVLLIHGLLTVLIQLQTTKVCLLFQNYSLSGHPKGENADEGDSAEDEIVDGEEGDNDGDSAL